MATQTKSKTVPTLQQKVEAAVMTWVKAEQSAIWSLIHIVHEGLEGTTGPERSTRLGALRTWVNSTLETNIGPGAAKDRAAHVSKIFKIAENAKKEDFERWEKAGTGFYKAYSEYTPAGSKEAKAAAKKPDTVMVDTKTGQIIEPPATPTTGAGKGETPRAAGAAATPDAPSTADAKAPSAIQEAAKDPDVTVLWSLQLDRNRKLWTNLVDHITEKKLTICTPDMVKELMLGLSKKEKIFRSTVETLLGNEIIRKTVIECINAAPPELYLELQLEAEATK